MEYNFKRIINYYETDKMGVVHHSNYIRFLEEARCAFLSDIGLPYNKLEDDKIMIPVLEVNCTYKRHVTFADTIIINTKIKDFNGVKFSVEYVITDEVTGNIVMIAKTKHCFTDTNIKPINLKKYNFEDYEKFNKTVDVE
jgi:acyl-CoA thioester hydrolase